MSNHDYNATANKTTSDVKQVDAYYVAKRRQWLVRCPFCTLAHFHGAEDGSAHFAGQRTPHCPPGVTKRDYCLIPAGDMTDAKAAMWERKNGAALTRLLKRMEVEKAQQKVRNGLLREKCLTGKLPPWHYRDYL